MILRCQLKVDQERKSNSFVKELIGREVWEATERDFINSETIAKKCVRQRFLPPFSGGPTLGVPGSLLVPILCIFQSSGVSFFPSRFSIDFLSISHGLNIFYVFSMLRARTLKLWFLWNTQRV